MKSLQPASPPLVVIVDDEPEILFSSTVMLRRDFSPPASRLGIASLKPRMSNSARPTPPTAASTQTRRRFAATTSPTRPAS